MKHKILIMLVAILFAGMTAIAQGVTTSALSGTITDNSNQGLPGANVVAVHNPTGTQYGVSTRADGRFNLPNLRVGGPYTIRVSFVGYQEQVLEDVFLSLGQVLEVNFVLPEENITLEEIVITAEDNLINSDRTGAETNIDNDYLRKLPTISRSAADIYRLAPSSDGNSFAGRNDQYNNFSLDGSIFNNPFGLDAATPGGQTDAQPISLDAIDQIQVAVAPYDVTQSGFTGASINAVTKSGTNTFSGTAFYFFRNEGLTGSKVSGRDIIVPDLTHSQMGLSIGGPIKKDKLFFFANVEIERREDLGSNFVANRGTGATNESRVTAADLDEVSRLLDSAYSYQTGPYENFLHNTDNEKGIIKLDWNINQNHVLTATYNFLNASKEKPAHPEAIYPRGPDLTTLQFRNSGYQINNIIHSGILELKSIFSNKYSNDLQVGYTAFRDSRDPLSEPFPVINIFQNGIPYIVAGHEPFSIHNLLDQDVIQFTDNFNIYSGKHAITIGTSFEKFTFVNSFNLFGYGSPFNAFPTLADFQSAVRSTAFQGDVTYARRNVPEEEWANVEPRMGQWALYTQDQIAVNEHLNLTLGVRMDLPLYFDSDKKALEVANRGDQVYIPGIVYYDEKGDTTTFDHSKLPDEKPLWSPRLGFNYDIDGDQTRQIRGGIGLFSGRFPFVWIGNHIANPSFFFYNVTKPDFQFPQVWRLSLGYDQKFGDGWTASVDAFYTEDENAMMVRKYSLKPPTGTLKGVDNRPIYTSADLVSNPGGNAAYVFTNTDLGYSVNTSLQLTRNWANGLFTSIAYNFNESKDASSIEAEISSDAFDRNPALGNVNKAVLANSIYGIRHRIIGSVYKTFNYAEKFTTTVSLFFEYAEGGRFSYTYSGDINGDGSPLNDLIYIPTDTEIDLMRFDPTTGDAERDALKDYIAQDDYLSERRGEYAGKYALLSPWYSRWDMRILQDFKIATGNVLQLSVDILNVGNLINSDWGVREFPQNTQPIGVTVDANGTPTYSFDPSLKTTFADDFSLLSRWQMQIGLRYIFN